jgi:peptidoglycan/LPS O-acetylase OafA/YrhL
MGDGGSRKGSVETSSNRFIPALEGVRGYAFIVVFLVHYQGPGAKPDHLWLYPWFLLLNAGWLVVPLFFALSGYLITQILYNSKGRTGYFKVFYGRRALRVFPLYYLTTLVCFAIVAYKHWRWNWHYLGYFAYLQNLTRHQNFFALGNHIDTTHFWSLAVEEHFYLVWPVVIWLCSGRKQLLRCCYGVLIGCFAVRVAWPLFESFGYAPQLAYVSTFTRVDGIICGAIVALATREHGISEWLKRASIVTVCVGIAILFYQGVTFGHSKPEDYVGIVWMTPLANVIATALLVLLLREETWLSRVSSKKWICKLGSMSYGLYLFHYLYRGYFMNTLVAELTPACGAFLASLLSMALAFAITWVLAFVAFHLIELPGQKAKRYLNYGPRTSAAPASPAETGEELVNVYS